MPSIKSMAPATTITAPLSSANSIGVWLASLRGIILVIVVMMAWDVNASSTSVGGGAAVRGDKYYIAVDAGTESLRVGLFNREGKLLASEATPYDTSYPQPGWFEQDPSDWWRNLGNSCRKTLTKAKETIEDFDESQIEAMCCDTTACSVLLLDPKTMEPLRPCLLWADSRSSEECHQILQKAGGDPALAVNCGGSGPLSAEWMIPKSLWLKRNERDLWDKAYVCECQDWINYKLTDRFVASGCNIAARWHFNAEEACAAEKGSLAGRPVTLLKTIGLDDVLDKWPQECVGMGEHVGGLTDTAAAHLGLRAGLSVIQGGPDAYVGMIGLGVCKPGSLALITGSSHLHLAISDEPITHDGIWGCYKGAPINGLTFAEGGQSSTGSMITWLKRLLGEGTGKEPEDVEKLGFRQLDEECEMSPPGARGLLCIETFQGSRTPVTDAKARGALVGLTLGHTRGDIWRAALESICFGTRAAIEAMEQAGLGVGGGDEIAVTGGATRSPSFLQMHADITGKTVVVGETDNAVLLGGAILARAGSLNINKGGEDSLLGDGGGDGVLSRCIADMVREAKRVYPDKSKAERYKAVYAAYLSLSRAIKETNHVLTDDYKLTPPPSQEGPSPSSNSVKGSSPLIIHQPIIKRTKRGASVFNYIVPSILAADFGNLASEAKLCEERGCTYLHVDVCDGGEMAQGELTLGPQAVAAIHRASPDLKLDCHVVASKPGLLIDALSKAGATRMTVQYECLKKATSDYDGGDSGGGDDTAMLYGLVRAFAVAVKDAGMKFGLSVAPDTPIEEVVELTGDLLEGNIIEFLDILAVKPGKGGQTFDQGALQKLRYAKGMLPSLPFLGIDGGVSHIDGTAQASLESGANYLIAGSAIFTRHRILGENDAEVLSNIDKMVELVLNS